MERNWSKQVRPCYNRPFDEQTFKTISHLTRRLTVPVVSIAPFCQVLQILSSIHKSHIICSSLEPALPKEYLSQHSFCFCCPYILSKEMFEGPFHKKERSHLRFSPSTTLFYSAEIVSALEYLHSLSVAYR